MPDPFYNMKYSVNDLIDSKFRVNKHNKKVWIVPHSKSGKKIMSNGLTAPNKIQGRFSRQLFAIPILVIVGELPGRIRKHITSQYCHLASLEQLESFNGFRWN